MNILLGDINAKVGREDISKPTIGNRFYTKLVIIMELIVAYFATSKNLIVKSTMFLPHSNIYKFISTPPYGQT
jgi:hypothetical protein